MLRWRQMIGCGGNCRGKEEVSHLFVLFVSEVCAVC